MKIWPLPSRFARIHQLGNTAFMHGYFAFQYMHLGGQLPVAVDLLIESFGRLAIEGGKIGVEQNPLAPNQVDALGDFANR